MILNVMIYSAVIVNIEDTDSLKRLLRLSGKNKLSQIMVSGNLIFLCALHYFEVLNNKFCSDIIDTFDRLNLNFNNFGAMFGKTTYMSTYSSTWSNKAR